MSTLYRTAAVAAILAVASSCAAKLPPAHTFNSTDWARVEALKPGVRVEVRYVTGDPPLRHTFAGTLRSAGPELIEMETRDGVQRLLAGRVLRVATGERSLRTLPLAVVGAALGAAVGGFLAVIGERNERDAARQLEVGGLVGGLIGASFGARLGDRRPVVVYSRSGSL